MHPVLFDIKGFKIYTYGPIMALGFLLAFFLVIHIARRRGEDVEFYMDLYIYVIIFGLLGAKLLYNFIEYKEFFQHPLRMMNCRSGGLVWYGGVIAATAFIFWYGPRRGKPVLEITDTLAAPLALGLAVGRWGCLMGGCCYGKYCDLPWAVTYPLEHETAGMPVHPTPIYASLASLLIALVIYLVVRKGVRRGMPTLLWFTLYPLARICIEFFRGDVVRGFIYKWDTLGISTSQGIGILILAIAAAMWVRLIRKGELWPDSEKGGAQKEN